MGDYFVLICIILQMSKYNYPSRCIHHSHKSGGTIQRIIDEFVNTEKDYHITLTAIHRALLSCKQQLCEPVSTGIVKWHMIKVGVYKRFPSYIEVNYDIEKKHLHHENVKELQLQDNSENWP